MEITDSMVLNTNFTKLASKLIPHDKFCDCVTFFEDISENSIDCVRWSTQFEDSDDYQFGNQWTFGIENGDLLEIEVYLYDFEETQEDFEKLGNILMNFFSDRVNSDKKVSPVYILNTSILTNYGSFNYEPIQLNNAKEMISQRGFVSAIGHQSTADILTSLLEQDVKMNRVEYKQVKGDVALVFKLKGRPQEGKLLSMEEIQEIGYEFGLLKMV